MEGSVGVTGCVGSVGFSGSVGGSEGSVGVSVGCVADTDGSLGCAVGTVSVVPEGAEDGVLSPGLPTVVCVLVGFVGVVGTLFL